MKKVLNVMENVNYLRPSLHLVQLKICFWRVSFFTNFISILPIYLYPSVHIFTYPSFIYLPINLFTHSSIHTPIQFYLSSNYTNPSTCLSFILSIYIYISINLPIFTFIHASITFNLPFQLFPLPRCKPII